MAFWKDVSVPPFAFFETAFSERSRKVGFHGPWELWSALLKADKMGVPLEPWALSNLAWASNGERYPTQAAQRRQKIAPDVSPG